MAKYLLLDIGGTSIKVATYENELSEVKEFDTNAKLGAENLIKSVKEIISSYKEYDGISISSAGQVDHVNGSIIFANENMPGYTGTKWKEILEKEFKVPVFVENDVNAAALGEANYGTGKDEKDFLCLTYGTGVGGAIIINKEVYRGATGSAGEFGTLLLHTDKHIQGQAFSGGYEKYASTTHLVELAKAYKPELDNGRKVFEHLDDPKILEIIDEWCNEIALGLACFIHLFNPSLIVLGGGVMEQELIFNKVNEKVYKEIMPSYNCVKLKKAMLGNKAGLYGALSRIQKENIID